MENGTPRTRLRPYRYTDLRDPLNMRILILLPADVDTEAIECELQEWSSHEREYEALTWCWSQGNPDARRTLRIHTGDEVRSFEVLEHLYDALLVLRFHDRRRFLWIDALCIHQAKAEERNQQVPRMRYIYGKASNVCVWLGQPTDAARTRMAFEFVTEHLLKLWQFDHLCKDRDWGEKWAALLEIMKLPWFSRRWIVQEIILARSATVHCGFNQMGWQEFADAVSLLVQVEETPARLSELMRKVEKYQLENGFFEEVPFLGATLLVKTSKDIFQRSVTGGHYKQLSLESLVSRLAIFKTSEPRDTIYGLLAMARDSEPYAYFHEEMRGLSEKNRDLLFRVSSYLPKALKARYDVNYKSQVIDVYQEFITFAIRNADPLRALDVICRPFAQEYTKEQDFSFDPRRLNHFSPEERAQLVALPSWVPNIKNLPFDMQPRLRADNTGASDPFDLRMSRKGGDSFVGPPELRLYSATGPKPYSKHKLAFQKRDRGDHAPSPHSMFVEGFVLDTVKFKEESAQGGNIPHTWFERLGWTDRQQEPPDEARWDAFWRTLVGNRDAKGSDPPIYYQRACKAVFKLALGESQHTFVTSDFTDNRTPTPIAGFLRRVQSIIWGRCLIETERGRLGLSYTSVSPGDRICILYGCSVPVVLTKVAKKDFEKKQEQEEDERADEEFVKRAGAKMRKVLDSRKAARGMLPSRLKQAPPRLQAAWLVWQRYNLLHVLRIAAIASLALWIARRGEALTAILLSLLALFYFLLSSSTRGFVEPRLDQWTPIEAGVTLLSTMLGLALSRQFVSPSLANNVSLVLAFFVTLFPQHLHLPARPVYIHLRDVVERRLDDVQTPSSSSSPNAHTLANLHWRLLAWIVALSRQLFGGGEPEVLRRKTRTSDHYWRLKCECYVHGMMDGEAIDEQFKHNLPEQVFELR